MKKIKSIHVPIFRNRKHIHTLEVRNDWRQSDWKNAAEMFPDAVMQTAAVVYPLECLARNPPTWQQIKRWKIIDHQLWGK